MHSSKTDAPLASKNSTQLKGSQQPIVKKNHPTYLQMIVEAIRHFKEVKGSSRLSIYKYIQNKYDLDRKMIQIRGNIAIRKGLKDGHLKTGKTSSSFKVGDKQKQEEKAKEKLKKEKEKEKEKKNLAKKKEAEKAKAKVERVKKTSQKSSNKSVLQRVKERASLASNAKKKMTTKNLSKPIQPKTTQLKEQKTLAKPEKPNKKAPLRKTNADFKPESKPLKNKTTEEKNTATKTKKRTNSRADKS